MRIPIFWVGRTTNDDRIVLALEIRDLRMPALGMGDHGAEVLGFIDQIRFEDGGLVTARLVPDDYDPVGLAAQADLDDLDVQRGEDDGLDGLVIRSGRLRGIHLGKNPAWPDMWIEEAS